MKKTPKKKSNSNTRYEAIELPSNNKDMEDYVVKHRSEINDQIADSIDYAMKNHLTKVEVFCFKNSDFVVMLHRKDFKESLENIFEFGMNNQQFVICTRVKKLIEKSDKLGFVIKYKYKK
jgi:hypothetical protein